MFITDNRFLLAFRIANLLFATFFVLCVIVPDSWCYGPTNPSPPPPGPQGPVTFREIIMNVVIFVWFVSALGLFFRSRLAWFGCLFGIGLAVYISLVLLIEAGQAIFFSKATDPHHLSVQFIIARMLADVTLLAFAMAFIAFNVGLVIGLIKSRRELRWP